MPSRCACSATPRSRSLCAASVSCTCSRYSTWHCARRITLRALDVVRYRESSTETSPNVTVSCRRRRAGRVVGRETGFLGFTRRVSRARPDAGWETMTRRREKVVVDERARRVGTRGTSRGRTRTLSRVSMSFSRIIRSTSTAWMARQSMRARRASNANAGGASEGASGPAASPPGATATGSAIPRFPPDPPAWTDGRRVLPFGGNPHARRRRLADVEARGTECRFTTRADALGGPSKTLAIVSEGVSEAVQRSDSKRRETCVRAFRGEDKKRMHLAFRATRVYALAYSRVI